MGRELGLAGVEQALHRRPAIAGDRLHADAYIGRMAVAVEHVDKGQVLGPAPEPVAVVEAQPHERRHGQHGERLPRRPDDAPPVEIIKAVGMAEMAQGPQPG